MDDLKRRLQSTNLSKDDVIAILAWQLSLPAEEMDCGLIAECDLFLAPDAPGMDEARSAQILSALHAHMHSGQARRTGTKHARTPHRRISMRAALIATLIALLMLALAVGAVAYNIRRGVLNFNEDWDWLAPLTHQDGADAFVTAGPIAHLALEHVTIDVIEAVTDGADLRVVYSVSNNEGLPANAEPGSDYKSVPGADEDGVHMCDFIVINGQDAYFDDAWQAPDEDPSKTLYYLQTNMLDWGVDIANAQELTLGLPLVGRVEYVDGAYTGKGLLQFTIPAKIPAEHIRSAELVEANMDGHTVTIHEAVFSPLNGFIQIHIDGLSRYEYQRDFTTMGEVYGPDDYALSGADTTGSEVTDTGLLISFAMPPPADGWPDTLVLALERNEYQPDWEAVIRITDTQPE